MLMNKMQTDTERFQQLMTVLASDLDKSFGFL